MSGLFSRFLTSLGFMKKQVHLLIVGLDNSGKTTLLNRLKQPSVDQLPSTIPTVGFTVDQLSHPQLRITIFDMSGQGRYRTLWQHFDGEADGVIFVLDVSDRERISVAKEELENLLKFPGLKEKQVPVLFMANKMDVEGGMAPSDCSDALGLDTIRDRPCPCSALTGKGVQDGFQWLSDHLKNR